MNFKVAAILLSSIASTNANGLRLGDASRVPGNDNQSEKDIATLTKVECYPLVEVVEAEARILFDTVALADASSFSPDAGKTVVDKGGIVNNKCSGYYREELLYLEKDLERYISGVQQKYDSFVMKTDPCSKAASRLTVKAFKDNDLKARMENPSGCDEWAHRGLNQMHNEFRIAQDATVEKAYDTRWASIRPFSPKSHSPCHCNQASI